MDISQYDCIYCGMDATDREHLRPYSFDSIRKRTESDYADLKNIVPSCSDCNAMLSNIIFDSLADKAAYVSRRLQTRFKKILSSPDWNEKELNELGYALRSYVKQTQTKKKIIEARIGYSKERSKLTELTPAGFWASVGKM